MRTSVKLTSTAAIDEWWRQHQRAERYHQNELQAPLLALAVGDQFSAPWVKRRSVRSTVYRISRKFGRVFVTQADGEVIVVKRTT